MNTSRKKSMRRDRGVMFGAPPARSSRVAGRGRGWGVYQLTLTQRFLSVRLGMIVEPA
jgi:hypothetical protein